MANGSLVRNVVSEAALRGNQTTGFAPSHLTAQIERAGSDRAGFADLRNRLAASVGNAENRQRRRLGAASSSVAAQAGARRPTSFAGAMDDAVRISRTRQGIQNRGEAAVQNQALKDRISFVRRGLARRGQIQEGLSQAVNIREGVNVGVSRADDLIRRSQADMFGGIAGATVGLLSDKDSRANAGKLLGRIFGSG